MKTRKRFGAFMVLIGMLVALMPLMAVADGNDSPQVCDDLVEKLDDVDSDEATVVASEGFVIDAICIKSGNDAFDGKQHSGLITADGTHSGYAVVGIGTNSVTVTAGQKKEISHIDYRVYEPEVDYCDPTQKPGGVDIKQWHERNEFDGDCVTIDYGATCGLSDAGIASNETGLFYEVRALVGAEPFPSGHPVADSINTFPITFDEDEFGGSVDVYLWVEGGESDFITGRDIPNFWEQTSVKVTVETDCEPNESTTTTTTPEETTTTQPEETTTTSEPEETTTTTVEDTTTTTVEDTTTTVVEEEPEELPFTGPSDSLPFAAALGAMLVASGGFVLRKAIQVEDI